MEPAPVVYREEVLAALGAMADMLVELRSIRGLLGARMKRRKKTWTKAEREAWDAHVDETVRTLRELVRKGREELRQRRAGGGKA